VVILTGMPETTYESAALDCGAEDFIDKSRGLDIVAKRVRRILGTPTISPSPQDVEIRSGKLLLRVDASRAYWDGIDLNLTVTEFNIVHLMVTNTDKHVTYRAIYDCVHHPGFVAGSGDDGYRTNVRSAIKRIRNKFRALDEQFCQIENFSAFGYRWSPASAEAA
jgi:two-component system response regulator ChvI